MTTNSNVGNQFTTGNFTTGNLAGAAPQYMQGQNELLLQQAIAYRYTTAFAELNRYAWDLQQKGSLGGFASVTTVALERGGMIIKGKLADGQERLLFRTDGQGRSYGFKYDDPKAPYHMQGFVNSPDAVKGLEFYKSLYKCCTAPGMTNAYMSEGLDAFKSGQVAMMMNWFAFFPGLYKDPNVGGSKIGFFVNPSAKTRGVQLGGQGISVVSYSERKDDALKYIKWFAQPDVQKKWWALGGYSCHKAVLMDPGFPKSAPFAPDFLKSMEMVQDFWAEPAYAELLLDMQKRVHDYVVADKGTAKEALDQLIVDWEKVFKEEGKLK